MCIALTWLQHLVLREDENAVFYGSIQNFIEQSVLNCKAGFVYSRGRCFCDDCYLHEEADMLHFTIPCRTATNVVLTLIYFNCTSKINEVNLGGARD
jgi:hypothetical protein